MKNLKSDINCILDAYESEIRHLINESKELMSETLEHDIADLEGLDQSCKTLEDFLEK